MRFFVLLIFVTGCNAIDGANDYSKGDAPGVCTPACIETSGTCLAGCDSTHTSCLAGCSNPGCTNKCDTDFNTCKVNCVNDCTSCGCATNDCQNAQVNDASGE